jgi:hypothetical protein
MNEAPRDTRIHRQPVSRLLPWLLAIILGDIALSSIVNVLSNDYEYRWVAVTLIAAALFTAVHYIKLLPPRSRIVRIISFLALALATVVAASALILPRFGSFLAVFAAVALVLLAVLLRTDRRSALRLLLATATVGGGIAELGYAVEALRAGDLMLGWSWTTGSVASICGAVGIAAERRRVVAGTYLVGGLAFGGVGAATLVYEPIVGWSFCAAGVAGLAVGGTTMIRLRGPLPAVAYVASGVTVVIAGMTMLAFDEQLLGLVCVGFGILDLGIGLGACGARRLVVAGALFAAGFLTVAGGLIAALLEQPLMGAAVALIGAAFVGYAWMDLDGDGRARRLWQWLKSEPGAPEPQVSDPPPQLINAPAPPSTSDDPRIRSR